jgi:16S rRNA (uracil1498-N3)-methyltransferase
VERARRPDVAASRTDRVTVATFFAAEPLVAGGLLTLGEDAAHHMRVRRLDAGAELALLDGAGRSADGRLVKLARSHAVVELGDVSQRVQLPAVHLMVPVADRDRMLWLAEKCVELGASSWRPVLWRRSRSVGSRGEGVGFQAKVRARMVAALTQSEAAWLPDLHPDAPLDRAIAAASPGHRVLLDPEAPPLGRVALDAPVTLAIGPEGGVEREERDALAAAGFLPASIPGNVLRFETAGIAALAIGRALLGGAGAPVTPPEAVDG